MFYGCCMTLTDYSVGLGKYFARHFPQFLAMAVTSCFLAIQSHFFVSEKIYYDSLKIVQSTRKHLQVVLCTHSLIKRKSAEYGLF